MPSATKSSVEKPSAEKPCAKKRSRKSGLRFTHRKRRRVQAPRTINEGQGEAQEGSQEGQSLSRVATPEDEPTTRHPERRDSDQSSSTTDEEYQEYNAACGLFQFSRGVHSWEDISPKGCGLCCQICRQLANSPTHPDSQLAQPSRLLESWFPTQPNSRLFFLSELSCIGTYNQITNSSSAGNIINCANCSWSSHQSSLYPRLNHSVHTLSNIRERDGTAPSFCARHHPASPFHIRQAGSNSITNEQPGVTAAYLARPSGPGQTLGNGFLHPAPIARTEYDSEETISNPGSEDGTLIRPYVPIDPFELDEPVETIKTVEAVETVQPQVTASHPSPTSQDEGGNITDASGSSSSLSASTKSRDATDASTIPTNATSSAPRTLTPPSPPKRQHQRTRTGKQPGSTSSNESPPSVIATKPSLPRKHPLNRASRELWREGSKAVRRADGTVHDVDIINWLMTRKGGINAPWSKLEDGQRAVEAMGKETIDFEKIYSQQAEKEQEAKEREERRLANKRRYRPRSEWAKEKAAKQAAAAVAEVATTAATATHKRSREDMESTEADGGSQHGNAAAEVEPAAKKQRYDGSDAQE